MRAGCCRQETGKEIIDSYPAPFDLFRFAAGVEDILVDRADHAVSGFHPNPFRPDLDIIFEGTGIGKMPW